MVKRAIGVRLPEDMREWINKQAEQNSRSVSGEILFRLRQSKEKEGGGKAMQATA